MWQDVYTLTPRPGRNLLESRVIAPPLVLACVLLIHLGNAQEPVMKKLICLLAVLVALMGLTVFELVRGGEADAVEVSDSSTSTSTQAAPTSRGARHPRRPDNDLPELQRVIRAQPDQE